LTGWEYRDYYLGRARQTFADCGGPSDREGRWMQLNISIDVGDEGSNNKDPYKAAYDLVRQIVRQEYHAEVTGFELESRTRAVAWKVGDVKTA
jgi:hypothetical protein